MTKTLVCAHRGDSSRHRENTVIAIQSAIEAGADIVEIDVRLTSDGQVVVIHDPTLDRLWGVNAQINAKTWAEVEKIGEGSDRIPLLEDVLRIFVGTSSMLMIDMDAEDPALPSLDVVRKSELDLSQIFWCGNLDAMLQIRAADASARIWMPWNSLTLPTKDDLADLNPDFVNLHYSFVTAKSVAAIHNLGQKVAVWTIDDEATMNWAIHIGVDSVTSNQLSLLQERISIAPQKGGVKSESSIAEVDVDRAMFVARGLGSWAIMVASHMDPGEISVKANPADIVTEIDVMIEAHVREVIAANFPGHNFIGEEMGGAFESDIPSWYLDPIDGTTNFANRVPWTSMSLALAFNRTPLVAVVIDPWRNSLFEAQANKGAKLNGKPLIIQTQTGDSNPLASRIVSTELAAYQAWPGMLELLEGLAENYCTMRIMGSGTLTLVGPAASRGVGAVIGYFSPIDHLAAALIVHESGGAVWDEEGKVNLFPERGGIMSSTQAAAQPLFDIWKRSIAR